MPLYGKDSVTAELVGELARALGVTKQEAVRRAVLAALKTKAAETPLRDRLAALRARHPLPRATGLVADKNFFDQLSGED
jgi:antitoxin VapB